VGEERLEAGIPVELGPHVAHVGRQRATVLELFVFPVVAQPPLEFIIAREMVDEVVRVKVRAAFDERRAAQ
jgi:hypothetical protein